MRKNGNLVWAEVVSVCGENYTATQFDSFKFRPEESLGQRLGSIPETGRSFRFFSFLFRYDVSADIRRSY